MTHTLIPVTIELFSDILKYVSPREYLCISLASFLAEDGVAVYPSKKVQKFVCLLNTEHNNKIDGVLLCTHTGILLHCLREEINWSPYKAVIRNFLAPIQVQCVIGEHTGNCFLESLIKVKPKNTVDYQLMTLETLPSAEQCTVQDSSFPFEIVRAIRADAKMLLPLQEDYEIEEVVPPGNPFNREACLANLSINLAIQYVYIGKSDEDYIAKAGTNAQGLNWDQIGGVYTVPKWRQRGIASALVAYTGRERIKAGRKVALFVKLINVFAIKAYKKAGFSSKSLFRIAYYNQ